jgi:NADPH:quinone reductase-like Zn-dependent oxidoreductase
MAIDAIAGAAPARLAACLADDGVVVNYGAMSGEACHLSSEMLTTRGIRLCGITPARQLMRHTPEERKAVYERIGEMLAAGRLQARIAATYELSDAINAVRHALQVGDKRHGKVVVRLKHLPPPGAAAVASATDSSTATVSALPATSESPPASRETSAPSAA